jgi:hypothetical protein
MSLIKHILTTLGGIERYGVASLCLFGVIFLGVLVFACTQRRSHLEHMAQVPLATEPEDLNPGVQAHE